MTITYYGQSCFGIKFGDHQLLIDPFISPNDLAKDINIDEIEADFILVSHAHQDHIADLESIAKRTGAMIISNYEIATKYGETGFDTYPLNHGGKAKFDFGTVKYVTAIHSSSFPDGSYGGNPGGFVIWNDDQCFYFSGDTALTMDMQLIPMTCPKLDVAILPIGDTFTMDAKDATIACNFIQCDRVIGCHYDTFDYIKIDQAEAKQTFKSAGKTLLLPAIGESLSI
jgi:L-ascorbate metabolism protein UlaG (beta-lactamase superfamily)